jgi:acetate kinase
MRHVLVLNAGSSSLKIALFAEDSDTPLFTGLADRIGGDTTLAIHDATGHCVAERQGDHVAHETHVQALADLVAMLEALHGALDVAAVGHRVVHGGLAFTKPVLVDEKVLAALAQLEPFAPLHQPHNLAGIRAATIAFPKALQIACFDTAFHRGHPFVNDSFALPREWYDKGVRRYGFHGLSYDFINGTLAQMYPDLHRGRVIVCHLGNGASACAIMNGQSVASTMGFSALDGLPMGTRCGQLDPGVLLYWLQQEKMDASSIADLLYKRSGLLGLSGLSNDMRELEASSSPSAREAIDYFVGRIKREIGGLTAAMGGLDALVFCGGIGENSRLIRKEVCGTMEWLGLSLDVARNEGNEAVISMAGSAVTILVIPTHEEVVIARAARTFLRHD